MAGEEFYKKRADGVVINNNKSQLYQARSIKAKKNQEQKRIDNLEVDMVEIKGLLKELLNRK